MAKKIQTLVSGLIVILLLSGCLTTESKKNAALKATATVTQMGSTIKERDSALVDQIEQLVVQILINNREIQRQKWLASKEAMKVKLWQDSDQKLNSTLEEAQKTLVDALDPVLNRLNDELASVSQTGNNPEKQAALALQLASTLAAAEQEFSKIREDAIQQMAAARIELLTVIDQSFVLPKELQNDADDTSTAKEILSILRNDSQDYHEAVDETVENLNKYISKPTDLVLFIKSLFGEELFSKIEPNLNLKLKNISDSVEEKISNTVKDVSDKITSNLK